MKKRTLMTIDIEATLAQYEDLEYEDLEREIDKCNYILKTGKRVSIGEYRQFQDLELLPTQARFKGVWHWFLSFVEHDGDFDFCVNSNLVFSCEKDFLEQIRALRSEFEQEMMSQISSYRLKRYLVATRGQPLVYTILETIDHWEVDKENLKAILHKNMALLGLELDDMLLSGLDWGSNIWIVPYTWAVLYQSHILEGINSNLIGNDFAALGEKNSQSLISARASSASIRGPKRRRAESKRVMFAKDLLRSNNNLSAADLARKYHETKEGQGFTIPTLKTYFQKARSAAIKELITGY